jgi:hypothetical protein
MITLKSGLTLICKGTAALGLSEHDIKITRGSDPRKVSLAWAIALSTTVSQGWIAARLTMRSRANGSQQIRRFEPDLQNQSDPRIRGWINSVTICRLTLFSATGPKLLTRSTTSGMKEKIDPDTKIPSIWLFPN